MKPKINENCVGCSACESICPEIFKIIEGKAIVLEGDYDANKTNIETAMGGCAVGAIEWEE